MRDLPCRLVAVQLPDDAWVLRRHVLAQSVLLHALGVDLADVEVAVGIGVEPVDAPGRARRDAPLAPGGDEPPIGVVAQELRGEPVRDPHVAVLREAHRVRREDVRPEVEEVPVLVEDLDPRVAAVGEVDAVTNRVEREAVKIEELAGLAAARLLRPDMLAVLREAVDPTESGDVEVAVRQPGDVFGLPRMVGLAAGLDLADLHHDLAAVGRDLEHLLALAVGYPDVALRIVRIDEDAVDLSEKLVLPGPRVDHPAVAVERD